jgi:intracellular sulfur oxidation DsrE/DsrF family protein
VNRPAGGILALAGLLAWTTAQAGEPVTGPVIDDFGPVYAVPDAALGPPALGVMRVVFDVVEAPADPAVANARIVSAARFLNMHARAGLPENRMALALVLHGDAGRAALRDDAYWERFDTVNPDRALLDRLKAAGAAIYLCGQTAGFRGYEAGQILPSVDLALSAMTALVRLQDDGYRLVP